MVAPKAPILILTSLTQALAFQVCFRNGDAYPCYYPNIQDGRGVTQPNVKYFFPQIQAKNVLIEGEGRCQLNFGPGWEPVINGNVEYKYADWIRPNWIVCTW